MVKSYEHVEIVNAGDIDLQHIFCPNCQNEEELVVSGYAVIPRQEILTKDNPTYEMDQSQLAFDIRRIDCPKCKRTFNVWDKSLYESQQTVNFLAGYIKHRLGEDMLKKGYVN